MDFSIFEDRFANEAGDKFNVLVRAHLDEERPEVDIAVRVQDAKTEQTISDMQLKATAVNPLFVSSATVAASVYGYCVGRKILGASFDVFNDGYERSQREHPKDSLLDHMVRGAEHLARNSEPVKAVAATALVKCIKALLKSPDKRFADPQPRTFVIPRAETTSAGDARETRLMRIDRNRSRICPPL